MRERVDADPPSYDGGYEAISSQVSALRMTMLLDDFTSLKTKDFSHERFRHLMADKGPFPSV